MTLPLEVEAIHDLGLASSFAHAEPVSPSRGPAGVLEVYPPHGLDLDAPLLADWQARASGANHRRTLRWGRLSCMFMHYA